MKAVISLATYFVKVAAVSFVSMVALSIVIGIAVSLYSQATNAPISPGALNIQGEDLFWVAVVSVIVGAVAVVVRLLRRRSR